MIKPNRLLVADDDPINRRILVRSLEKAGYEIVEASTGLEALEQALEHLPDLILLDIGMPGRNGFEVCEALKSQPETADRPVIFITSKSQAKDVERAFSVGASDYVTKPMHLQEVKARVSVHLGLRRAKEELRASHLQLLQAQKLESIGQLAAGVAHEINTPTQYVSDNTRFLEEAFGDLVELLDKITGLVHADEDGDTATLKASISSAMKVADLKYLLEEVPRSLEQSIDGLGRIAEIIRAMKEFSHPGTKEVAPVDIHRAIESTMTVASNEWKYVAAIETDFAPNLPQVPCALGDLNQVVLNLIVNAAHAIGERISTGDFEKGLITITTREVGEWVEICVSDTGGGIPEEIRDRVFDPFFTTKEVGKGTGQGLAMAHSTIVDAHGGSINLQSVLGEGSTFTIRLPFSQGYVGEAA